MKLRVNNKIAELKGHTILDFLRENNQLEKKRVAVAVNNTVIPKKDWNTHELFENDSIIIIIPAQGG